MDSTRPSDDLREDTCRGVGFCCRTSPSQPALDQLPTQPLVKPLSMVMRYEFLQDVVQMPFPEEDKMVQALVPDRLHEALRVRTAIRALRRYLQSCQPTQASTPARWRPSPTNTPNGSAAQQLDLSKSSYAVTALVEKLLGNR